MGDTSIYEVLGIGMTEGLGEPLVEQNDLIELLSDIRHLLRLVKYVSELVPCDKVFRYRINYLFDIFGAL